MVKGEWAPQNVEAPTGCNLAHIAMGMLIHESL